MLKLTGKYKIKSVNNKTNKIIKTEEYNILTEFLYNKWFQFLNYSGETPAADDLDLNYIALGTGTLSTAITDTQLETEYYRSALISKQHTGLVFTAKTTIAPTAGNPDGGAIKELGMFANGSEAADTGDLISRVLVNINKNSNIKLLITWSLELTEV